MLPQQEGYQKLCQGHLVILAKDHLAVPRFTFWEGKWMVAGTIPLRKKKVGQQRPNRRGITKSIKNPTGMVLRPCPFHALNYRVSSSQKCRSCVQVSSEKWKCKQNVILRIYLNTVPTPCSWDEIPCHLPQTTPITFLKRKALTIQLPLASKNLADFLKRYWQIQDSK